MDNNAKGSQTELNEMFVNSVQFSSPLITKKQSIAKIDEEMKPNESMGQYNSRVLGKFLRMS